MTGTVNPVDAYLGTLSDVALMRTLRMHAGAFEKTLPCS